jgi:cellulose synthase/poly-beta-1,6-N-acetylglucosamine synthase-like glycosyltransferase
MGWLCMYLRIGFISLSLILSLFFFVYGFNHYYLLFASRRYRSPELVGFSGQKPRVCIHLPIYNEKYVIRRLLAACARSADEFGRDKVRILVIDDSDDDTVPAVDELTKIYLREGYRMEILRRGNRQGFKAGALQAALERTEEEYIAIFDADFIPPDDFLLRTLPHFLRDENLGIVQSRWTHVNRNYNSLTRAAAIGIDVHFLIEQTGRYAMGYFQNFNGSAGVLRRKALVEAGGWQADTLAEDLDVSYRIQLLGYRILYLKDLQSPGEVPPTVPSFKRQQARWACGSLRTAKKILPRLLTDRRIGLMKRLQALIHLTGYMVHPLMFFSYVLTFLAIFLGADSFRVAQFNQLFQYDRNLQTIAVNSGIFIQNLVWVAFGLMILICTSAVWVSPIVILKIQGFPIARNLSVLLVLFLLGFGVSVSNTLEAGKALFTNRNWAFQRTPKYALLFNKEKWIDKKYQVPINFLAYIELVFVCLGLLAIVDAIMHSNFGVLIILIPYTSAYAYVFFLTLLQSHQERVE